MSAWAWVGRLVWAAWALLIVVVVVRLFKYPFDVPPRMAYAIAGLSVLVLVLAILTSLQASLARARPPLRVVSGVVALTSLVSYCVGSRWHFFEEATAAPPAFITDVTAAGQFDSVLAYARSLSFDSVTHNVPDSQLITDTLGGFHAVKAWIAPAVGANLVSYDDLAYSGSGHGRVVARIRVDTTYGNRGYPLLNLPAGVSYVWVDSLELHDTTGTFRALVIPDQPGGAVVRFPDSSYSHYYRSGRAIANFPMARWVLFGSSCTNVPCSRGCCQSCPAFK